MRWLCLCLLLAACAAPVDPVALRARLTPAQVETLQVPLVFISAPRINVAATLVPVGRNGPVRVWQAGDGAQVAMRGGVVTATHGLGFDLVAADLDGVMAALAGGPAQYRRQFSYLDGDLGIMTLTYTCQLQKGPRTVHGPIEQPATPFHETCVGANTFRNIYHRGADGTLWWSRQWVSAAVGALEIEVIKP